MTPDEKKIADGLAQLERVLGLLREYYTTTDPQVMDTLWTEIEGGIEMAMIDLGWEPGKEKEDSQ